MELERIITPNPLPVNFVPTWSPEKVNALRDLIAAGLTFGEIGRELGVTRNSAISKAQRCGFHQPGRIHLVETRRQGGKIHARRRKDLKRRRVRTRVGEVITLKTIMAPDPCDIKPTTADNPVTLDKLRYHHCRWPCSGSGAFMVYCGGQRGNGWFPYCDRHAFIATRVTGSTE